MSTQVQTPVLIPSKGQVQATVALSRPRPESIEGLPSLNYLMSLSECMWEKATEATDPGVVTLFQNHANLEYVIDVMEGRQEPEDPESFLREAAQAIRDSWALFGHGLAEAMEDYLSPNTPFYPALPSGAVYQTGG